MRQTIIKALATALTASLCLAGGTVPAQADADTSALMNALENAPEAETFTARHMVADLMGNSNEIEKEAEALIPATLEELDPQPHATASPGKLDASTEAAAPRIDESSASVSVPNPISGAPLSIAPARATNTRLVNSVAISRSDDGSKIISHATNDGGAQIIAVTDSPKPGYSTDFTVSAPAGYSLHQDHIGRIEVRNLQGEAEGIINEAWAIDSSGRKLASHFELNGNTVTQVLDEAPSVSGPVALDPSFLWWAGTVASCAVGIAPFLAVGPAALALKAPRLISRISAMVKSSKVVAGIVQRLGGIKAAAVSLIKAAIIKVRNAIPASLKNKVPAPVLDARTRDLANGLYSKMGSTLFSALGVGGCWSLITAGK